MDDLDEISAADLQRLLELSRQGLSEGLLGWTLALLSRGSASITVSMFHAVASTDAQRAMLLAAAEKSLGSTVGQFKELMEDFRPRYGERSQPVTTEVGTRICAEPEMR